MKKIIFFILLLLPLISMSQYADVGVRVSKFNNGITAKIAVGGCDQKGSGPYGFEGFLARSYIANWGYLLNISTFKNWNVSKSDFFIVTKVGANIATYKNFYYINNNYTGFIYYDSKYTTSLGLTTHIGVEWISSDFPISIEATANPWYEFQNIGPEFIDYNLTIKYQLVSLY